MPGLQVPNAFNLTQITNTQRFPPQPNSQLAAYLWGKQQSLHVIYVDTNGHVRELYKVGAGMWYTNDLSADTGYTGWLAPMDGSPLVGYVWENQGSEHVIYIDRNGSIRELYYTGNWYGNDLSSSARGALPPLQGTPVTAYAAEFEDTQHVIYFNENGNVQEIYYSGGGWNAGEPLDLTAGAARPGGGSALTGYAAEYEQTQHVVYFDVNGLLHELYRSGGVWQETLLLESSGGQPNGRPGSPLVGYAYSYGNVGTQHVIYVDVNSSVHELYREGNAWRSGVTSGSIPVSS